MAVDEIEALKIALLASRLDGQEWEAPFTISRENGGWEVGSEPRQEMRISDSGDVIQRMRISDSGEVLSVSAPLNPVSAFSIAREYAAKVSLRWKPMFTLSLLTEHWVVGSCQSQFGGQTYIYVSHDGVAYRHSVNPK